MSPSSGPRSTLTRLMATAVGLGTALALLPASGTATATATAAPSTVPEFYDPPAQLPDADGALIRTEPLTLGVRLPGPEGPLPGTATRLMYRSTDAGGQPIAVTGAYIEPAADWAHGGPRPLVALAPGTMGQGDQCAASLALETPLGIDLGGGSISFGYENLAVYRFLARGVAVVVTDYAGLGTTDRVHTYVNRVDEGHALLDAARAARALDGTSLTADSPVGLYGYSQGGGATAAAAELQPVHAPELPLVGSYVGAPPADLTEVMEGIDGSALAGAIGWTINGAAHTEPGLGAVIEGHLDDDGREALNGTATMCVGDAILRHAFADTRDWTTTGRSVGEIVAAEPEVRAFLDEQRIGERAPTGPVRVATGVEDDIVPHAQARQLATDWCALGADVSYAPIHLPGLGDGTLLNHLAPLITDQGAAISWLTDRFNGEPTEGSCP
ncbi:lipase family protein [Streptomyces radicis]|uniref:Triacylglycerol lipase n=1 Tax=Streptomyces radicis TaxID=1750517 RepID=A0A3A9WP07_9ACTN|nr:lipase family protein [Streptomyces radicis]RKN07917.1 triacylglycerol lipase [Streptomyces radicis]RKN20629.1 triacylglycerol lipase [Streptomyces radicis]